MSNKSMDPGSICSVSISSLMEESGVAFGTSGARGLVTAMTDRVCYAYTTGFLQYLEQIGEFSAGGAVALAGDLRPSTPRIAEACAAAIVAAGGRPLSCGFVPTPAMALAAFDRAMPSLMITGSHIPDDRNGIKFYRPGGEVLKSDEAEMRVQQVELATQLFDAEGNLTGPRDLGQSIDVATGYIDRYVRWFGSTALSGLRLGIYQHSAVGRDLLVDIITRLGGEAVAIGRSETFIPVDTEAVRAEDVALAAQWARGHGFDAILSTDGDSDRPLLANEEGRWIRGDLLGVIAAQALGADAVVTPVSSNSAVERCGAFATVVRTRIGSPFVIDAMNDLVTQGYRRIIGYEANGGLLLGSNLQKDEAALSALPTRDAVLPMIAAIVASREVGGLVALERSLPQRATVSDRIQDVPVTATRALFDHLLGGDGPTRDMTLTQAFGADHGGLHQLDLTDGIRMTMADDTIVHLRASGNAPELRCYTEAATTAEAEQANRQALKRVGEMIAAAQAA